MEEVRDLSPITVLLLGCVVAALVFKAIERAYSSAIQRGLKAKFKRRTREEEEAALLLARAEAEQVAEGEEEEEEEEEELGAADFGTATGSLSRRDLAKIQKRRERQERREQFQALLQHEKDLRALREKEDAEREEFERQRDAERAKLAAKSAPKVTVAAPAPPSDQDVAGFFHAKKETLLTEFDAKYPFLSPQVRAGMVDRLVLRGGFVRAPKRGAVYRVDEEDLARVRQLVVSAGSALHSDLAELLAG